MSPAVAEQTALDPDEAARVRRMSILLACSFFVATFAVDSTLKLPFQFLLKNQLHLPPQALAGFFALGGLAWYFKPLAGILSDAVPLFGTRRRSYLLLSATLAGVFWLLLGIVPHQYKTLLAIDILVNAMIVFVSSATGGLLVEQGQATGATGRFSALRNVTYTGAGLFAYPIAGYLAAKAFGWTCTLCAMCFFLLVPVVYFLLREPRVANEDVQSRAEVWAHFRAQWQTLRRARPLWLAAVFQMCFYIAPGFLTPLLFYQTDQLHFTSVFIGWIGMANAGAGVLGSLLYGVLCRRYSMRVLLITAILLYGAAALGYLHYRSHADAWVVESCYGFALGMGSVVLFDMAARAAPKGSEALAYALLMSAANIGIQMSDVIGSYLNGVWHVSFLRLVPINCLSTLATLLLVPLLPKALLAGRDGDAHPAS